MSKKEHKQDKKKAEKEQINQTQEPGKPEKLGRKEYDKELERLHVELVKAAAVGSAHGRESRHHI